MPPRSYTVSQVARLAHVTVRALHHYDELGLLVPSLRSRAGYRLYAPADLKRLQRIVLLRELGFSLDAVGALLSGATPTLHDALFAQRARLQHELENRRRVLNAIEIALDVTEREETTMADVFEGVDQFESIRHEQEARERWGDTAAYKESSRRTQRYTKDDWLRMEAEAAALLDDWALAFASSGTPASDAGRALAERARLHIDRWFYPCSRAQHAKVSELYVSDERYRAYYDTRAAGLADYVAACIASNADSEE